MIGAYYKLQDLQGELRSKHKIRSKARIDCTHFTDHIEYRALKKFINKKGQMYLYITPAREVVRANSRRRAEICLTNGDNLSSLYFEDLDYPEYAYGDYGNDGLLFILNKEQTEIEVLIIQHGRNLIQAYYQRLIDGDLDELIQKLRDHAEPFYAY